MAENTPSNDQTQENPIEQPELGTSETEGPTEIAHDQAQDSGDATLPAEDQITASPAQFGPLQQEQPADRPRDIKVILDIPVELSIELGRTAMVIEEVMNLGLGSVIELNKSAGDPVEILVNNKLIANGEVVVVDGKLGVRVSNVIDPGQRVENLG